MDSLDGRRVLVMGLGLFGGGVGLTRYLCAHGARVTVTDLRPAEKLAASLEELRGLDVELVLGEHREADFRSAESVFVNPAVPKSSRFLAVAREAGAVLTSEINLFVERYRGPILAVTGSNGKTTTTGLLGAMVQAHDPRTLLGGNMGVSLLDRVDDSRPDVPAVLELSSFQLEDLGAAGWSPRVAVVTNLTPNHLDRHGTFAAYIEAKSQILLYQPPDGLAVLNAEDEEVRRLADLTPAPVVWFGLEEAADFHWQGSRLVRRMNTGDEPFFELDRFRLRGEHNIANALAAAAAAHGYGVPLPVIAQALADFRPIAHRLEEVAVRGGVTWFNDSIATTPESAVAALRSFAEPLWLIAGGYDKGMPFDELGREIARRATGCLLIGKTAPAVRLAVENALGDLLLAGERPRLTTLEDTGTLEDAVARAAALAAPGSVVVLSPACASYDQFINFVERGERFRSLVLSLPK